MKKNSPKNTTNCGLCHQPLHGKRYPARYGAALVAFVHPGCGLQGSTNGSKARIRRRLLVAGHLAAGTATKADVGAMAVK